MDDIRAALMCSDRLCKRMYFGARDSSLSKPGNIRIMLQRCRKNLVRLAVSC
jgi:hypothetical protein